MGWLGVGEEWLLGPLSRQVRNGWGSALRAANLCLSLGLATNSYNGEGPLSPTLMTGRGTAHLVSNLLACLPDLLLRIFSNWALPDPLAISQNNPSRLSLAFWLLPMLFFCLFTRS